MPITSNTWIFVFLICYSIQILYILYFYGKLLFYSIKEPETEKSEPVSVVIAARNEEKHLPRLIETLSSQNHPEFEVIIVNDRSTDQSQNILDSLSAKYNWLKTITITTVPNGYSPKKHALQQGIQAASHKIILLTDADCLPVHNNWISRIANKHNSNHDVVIGFSPLRTPNNLFGLIAQFETLVTGIRYLSLTLRKLPYMAVGRNLSYKKTVFKEVDGFNSHINILSGDDDLFVQSIQNKRRISICIHPESLTLSDSKPTLTEWLRQKRRHLSTGKRYKNWINTLLSTEYLTLLLTYISFVFVLFGGVKVSFIIGLFLLRTLVLFTTFTVISGRMNLKRAWLTTLPVIEPLYILYIMFVSLWVLFSKPKTWN